MIKSILLLVTVTAYVPDNPVGAMGEPVLDQLTCAVSRDLSHLKGTWVEIEGYGPRYVNDVTHARFSKRIDLVMCSRSQALEHGIKKATLKYEKRKQKQKG